MHRLRTAIAASAATRLRRAVFFGVLALVVMAPALVMGVGRSDSGLYNLVWASQFAAAWPADPYPRWLPDSFGGRGSPVFLFYPPIAFLMDAALNALTLGTIATRWRLAVDAWLLLWLSGVTMDFWLGRRVTAGVALAAGAALILAPYHLLDQYWRGALAEFAAIAVLPLVLMGTEAAARSWRGVPWLGAGLALLIATHLPSAVLACVTVVPAVLWGSVPSWHRAAVAIVTVRAAVGGVLGFALASAYVAPALLLQDSVSFDLLWRTYYLPIPWLLTSFVVWPSLRLMSVVASLSVANLVGAIAVLAAWDGKTEPGTGLARALAAASIFAVLMLAGLIPYVWDIPLLAKVQFPWRLLGAVEVATIGALALSAARHPARSQRRVLLAMAVLSAPGVAIIATQAGGEVWTTSAWAQDVRSIEAAGTPDTAEYLPRGVPREVARAFSETESPAMPPARAVMCLPETTRCERDRDGSIVLEAAFPTTVTVQTFYFPGWGARTEGGGFVAARPAPPNQVLAFDLPAGTTRFRTERVATGVERMGGTISTVALVVTLAWLFVARRRRVAA